MLQPVLSEAADGIDTNSALINYKYKLLTITAYFCLYLN